jgi:ATP-dependent Clp protease adaptor protein ClpS
MKAKELEKVDELLENLFDRKLIVLNDNHNNFDWVIHCFIIILGHTREQAEQCAMLIHNKGKYAVKEGSYEELSPFKDALRELGLGVVIE